MDTALTINPTVLAKLDAHRERFRDARPFRHVVIDDFFEPAVAAALLQQFPAFEAGNARTENGDLGHKSTVEKIRGLGSAYAKFDDAIQTPAFLDAIGRITGIDGLLYDPWYFGGGTHCNRAGQDLDAHVDFNRHPIHHWHRRLNLIVYLNQQWHDDWGGSLALHSDPRSPDDRVKLVTPLYNRCVIFETTESSWHGFSTIAPPADGQDTLRRSVALYFYSEDRPDEEQAATHSTIYVDRPLPEHIAAGHTLSDADIGALRNLLSRRDQHIKRLYHGTSTLRTELEQANAAIHAGITGKLRLLAHKLRRFLH